MRGKPVPYLDFRGGVNARDAPFVVGEKECIDARNVLSTTRGSIVKRRGITKRPGNVGAEVKRMVMFRGSAGQYLLTLGEDNVVHSIQQGNGTVAEVTTAELPLTLRGATISELDGSQRLIVADGHRLKTWKPGQADLAPLTLKPGTEPNTEYLATADLPANVEFVRVHESRVFIAAGNKLYWSEVASPDIWPKKNVAEIDAGTGLITGLGTTGTYLLVFKPAAVFAVFDSNTGANRNIARTIGTVAPDSIVETSRGCFWLTADKGVYRTDGSNVESVSGLVEPIIGKCPPNAQKFAAGGEKDDHYYLSISQGSPTKNEIMLDLDIDTGAWWLHTPAVNCMVSQTVDSTSQVDLTAGIPGSHGVFNLYEDGALADHDGGIDWYWVGPWWAFGRPEIRKRMRMLHVEGRGQVDVGIARDFQVGADITERRVFPVGTSEFGDKHTEFGGEGLFGDVAQQSAARVYSIGVARVFQVQLSQAASESYDEVNALIPAIQPRSD